MKQSDRIHLFIMQRVLQSDREVLNVLPIEYMTRTKKWAQRYGFEGMKSKVYRHLYKGEEIDKNVFIFKKEVLKKYSHPVNNLIGDYRVRGVSIEMEMLFMNIGCDGE